jgi:tRNA A37 threonylcarbamoyladenosine dehydratase
MPDRFQRLGLLVGAEGLKCLEQSSVLVLGVGGVGSFVVEALARSAVGRLILVDMDVVDISNFNRQLHSTDDTIGHLKVEVMRDRILKINPRCQVEILPLFYDATGNEQIFSYQPDYIVDAIDTITSKVDIIVGAKRRGVPLISSMGAANKFDPSQFVITDISKTHMDPVAKIMRRLLRERGIYKGVQVAFSPEQPFKVIDVEKGESRLGSTAFVPPAAGLLIASKVVKDLLS